MVAAFDERREYLHRRLTAMKGVSCIKPTGAFYALPNISGTGLDSLTFSERLLEEEGVAVVPGGGGDGRGGGGWAVGDGGKPAAAAAKAGGNAAGVVGRTNAPILWFCVVALRIVPVIGDLTVLVVCPAKCIDLFLPTLTPSISVEEFPFPEASKYLPSLLTPLYRKSMLVSLYVVYFGTML